MAKRKLEEPSEQIASPEDLQAATEPEEQPEVQAVPPARTLFSKIADVLRPLGFDLPMGRTLMGVFTSDDRWKRVFEQKTNGVEIQLWNRPAAEKKTSGVDTATYRLTVVIPGMPVVSLELTTDEAKVFGPQEKSNG